MVGFPKYAEARRAATAIVAWRDIEADLQDIVRLHGHETTGWADMARRLADRINDRHYRKSKALWDTVAEYRELRATKDRNDHDRL